jgi:hypothetical protein
MGVGRPVRVGSSPEDDVREYHIYVDGKLIAPYTLPTHYAPLALPAAPANDNGDIKRAVWL